MYVDDPAQPSRPGSASDATINVTKQKYLFFEKVDGHKPPLKMTIREPRLLGLKGSRDTDLDEFVDRVLTACSLHMEYTRLSAVAAYTKQVRVRLDGPREDARTERKPDNMEGIANSDLDVSLRPTYAVHGTENLDEQHVLDALKMIHAVYAATNPSAEVANLRVSLESYYHGIVSHHGAEVLKGLYVALEKAVNFDKNVAGSKFDSKVCALVGDPALGIDRIRTAYARLKHHTSEKQLPNYPDRLAVFRFAKELRPAAAKAILRRMNEVAGKPQDARTSPTPPDSQEEQRRGPVRELQDEDGAEYKPAEARRQGRGLERLRKAHPVPPGRERPHSRGG